MRTRDIRADVISGTDVVAAACCHNLDSAVTIVGDNVPFQGIRSAVAISTDTVPAATQDGHTPETIAHSNCSGGVRTDQVARYHVVVRELTRQPIDLNA